MERDGNVGDKMNNVKRIKKKVLRGKYFHEESDEEACPPPKRQILTQNDLDLVFNNELTVDTSNESNGNLATSTQLTSKMLQDFISCDLKVVKNDNNMKILIQFFINKYIAILDEVIKDIHTNGKVTKLYSDLLHSLYQEVLNTEANFIIEESDDSLSTCSSVASSAGYYAELNYGVNTVNLQYEDIASEEIEDEDEDEDDTVIIEDEVKKETDNSLFCLAIGDEVVNDSNEWESDSEWKDSKLSSSLLSSCLAIGDEVVNDSNEWESDSEWKDSKLSSSLLSSCLAIGDEVVNDSNEWESDSEWKDSKLSSSLLSSCLAIGDEVVNDSNEWESDSEWKDSKLSSSLLSSCLAIGDEVVNDSNEWESDSEWKDSKLTSSLLSSESLSTCSSTDCEGLAAEEDNESETTSENSVVSLPYVAEDYANEEVEDLNERDDSLFILSGSILYFPKRKKDDDENNSQNLSEDNDSSEFDESMSTYVCIPKKHINDFEDTIQEALMLRVNNSLLVIDEGKKQIEFIYFEIDDSSVGPDEIFVTINCRANKVFLLYVAEGDIPSLMDAIKQGIKVKAEDSSIAIHEGATFLLYSDMKNSSAAQYDVSEQEE